MHNSEIKEGRFEVIVKTIPYLLTAFLVVLNVLPFLAPLLVHFGQEKAANLIYGLYSFLCHQKAHRSMFIFDEQCAWCMRDTFIWSAMLFCAIVVFKNRNIFNQGLSLKLAAVFALPMVLDGSIQLIGTIQSIFMEATPFYESNNLFRAITGAMFGISIGLYLFPMLKKEIWGYNTTSKTSVVSKS